MRKIDLGLQRLVTLTADGNTPEDQLPYAGMRINIPEELIPPAGELAELSMSGVTVHGQVQQGPGGDTIWLLSAPVDPAWAEVDKIPGPQGWSDPQARQLYYDQGKYLIGQGVPGVVVWPGLARFYQYAAADIAARTP